MLTNWPRKNLSSQVQSNWFSFQETSTYKRQRRADLNNPDMNRVKLVRQQVTHGYDVSSFFCNYYCLKWYQKHWICNWLVKENKFGAVTFWVRYLFPSLYLFSGTFFRDLLERIGLPVLSLLPFLIFVNFEGLTLRRDSFTSFVHISILCLRH